MHKLPSFGWHGKNLERPECVLCTSDGSLFVSDWGGGVCHISPTGEQRRILATDAPHPILPNGIALQKDGSFLLANLGDEGGVWRLTRNGHIEPFLLNVGSQSLPPCNYVMVDGDERVWITVSTRHTPRARAYRCDIADGFIIRVDGNGAEIVADGIGYTNEVQVHPDGDWLYVNETFGRKLSRYALRADGSLGSKETVAEFGRGMFPDGLAFDEDGGAWVVSIVSNTVIRIDADGRHQLVISDADDLHIDAVENAFKSNAMGRSHLDNVKSHVLKNVSSIAFGGPQRRIAYLGCLLGRQVASFETNVAGVAPVHWNWNEPWTT